MFHCFITIYLWVKFHCFGVVLVLFHYPAFTAEGLSARLRSPLSPIVLLFPAVLSILILLGMSLAWCIPALSAVFCVLHRERKTAMQCRLCVFGTMRAVVSQVTLCVCVCVHECEVKRYPIECKLCIAIRVQVCTMYVCIGTHRTVKCSAG